MAGQADFTYHIVINEQQRLALMAVLDEAPNPRTDNDEPLEYWEAMLEKLPLEELTNPRCLHGFCL